MITVAKYSSREEAYIAKALLEAAGIQVFIDDAQFAETKTIDIRIPESHAEQARSILADREETIHGVEGKTGPRGNPKGEFKDILLFIKGGGLWIFGYVLLALILRVFGVILPMNPLSLGLVFLVGGLISLIFGGPRGRSSRSH